MHSKNGREGAAQPIPRAGSGEVAFADATSPQVTSPYRISPWGGRKTHCGGGRSWSPFSPHGQPGGHG